MRPLLHTAAVMAALLVAAPSAYAQGFLKRLADRAVSAAERNAERLVEDARDRGEKPAETGEGGGSDRAPAAVMTPRAVRGGAPRAAAPAPEPAAAPAKPIRYTGDLPVPPEAEAARAAYNSFGEVDCNDCEGGIDFDGRPKFAFDQFSGQYEERARRAASWPIGHVHRWQGKASAGTLTVVAEATVEGFRCRQLRYRLVKGNRSAERPGLICLGMVSSESSNENWHEIY